VTVFEGFRQLYRGLGNFILQAWWVVLLLAVPALSASYVDDWTIWDSLPIIAAWFLFCTVLQLGGIYILLRFLALNGDMKRALAANAASIRTFIPFALVWTLCLLTGSAVSELFAEYPAARWAYDALLGLVIIWLSPWAVSSPGGQQTVALTASFDAAFPHTIWALLFLLLAWLPISLAETGVFLLLPEKPSQGGAILQGVSILVLIPIAKWLITIGSMYVIAIKAGLQFGPGGDAPDGDEVA
jgi:hypothetical protein